MLYTDAQVGKGIKMALGTRKGSTSESLEVEKGERCGVCKKVVGKSERGIQCEICELWFHSKCEDIADDIYKLLNREKYTSTAEGVIKRLPNCLRW